VSASDKNTEGDLLLQEVDEELRHEQYLRLWARYGNYIIGAGLAVVVLVAGYQGWQSWQTKQRQDEAARFSAAQEMILNGDRKAGLDAMAQLAAEGHGGLSAAARSIRAEAFAREGNVGLAVAAWEDIAASSAPPMLRDLAVLKLALLTLDSADPAALEKRVAPLTAPGAVWHYAASEIVAMLAFRAGDHQRAQTLYKQLAEDPAAPQGIRARAAEMLAVTLPADAPSDEKSKG